MSNKFDLNSALKQLDNKWKSEIIEELSRYIEIPAKSPAFDQNWQQNGYLKQVLQNGQKWIDKQNITGIKHEIVEIDNRTPVLFFEIAASAGYENDSSTVLVYGHMDKQPEFDGWLPHLGPWKPVLENNKLYGRGGADDGYALYAGIAAVQALQLQGVAHPKIVGIIETCEESGSYDLPAYLELLLPRLGEVALVVCLDSGAGNYDQMWLTTSLRGNSTGLLRVEVLSTGVHSGASSGTVPSSFRIARQLIERVEDSSSGKILLDELHCEIPADRQQQIKDCGKILGAATYNQFPFCQHDGGAVKPTTEDATQAIIKKSWQPTLSVTGAGGLPLIADAGNVLRPYTELKLSFRLPPLIDGELANQVIKAALEKDAPYNAKVSYSVDVPGSGWNSPSFSPWLQQAVEVASQQLFNLPCAYLNEGGTIPLMNLLQKTFPQSQFMVCGVLGPNSNAHGPNESLDIPYAIKVNAVVSKVIAAFE